jgi:hypothetical protein
MKFSSKWAKCWLTVVALLLVATAGHTQDSTTGSISGTVTDSTGAVVKGATVVITNTDRNHVERTLTTNGNGFYTAPSLPLGAYSVRVSEAGFKTVNVTKLTLNPTDALTVNRALVAGDTSETVSVTADEARVNMEDATSAGLIDSTQINNLVMVSRNYESLMNLQPGVVFGGASDNIQRGPVGVGGAASTNDFSINGGRYTSNNWTIDGADNVDRGANATLYVYPSPDAIAEFKTLRGQYSAQFGRNSSGQIDVVTKSGTNGFHGSAYEYFRNDAFDAAGYYNDTKKLPVSKYRYNDFGFSFGGPVWIPKLYNGKNKTFFFVSEEWLREVTYATLPANVPTQAERNGDFSNDWYKNTAGSWVQGPIQICSAYTFNTATQSSNCNTAGTQITGAQQVNSVSPTATMYSGVSPTALAYLKDVYSAIPLPNEQANAAIGNDPHQIDSNVPNTYNNLNTVVRIDQQFGQKLSLLYRYMHDTFPSYNGAGTFISSPIPGLSATTSRYPGTQQLGKATYVFSPTLVMNIGYAYSNGSILTEPQGKLLSQNSPDVNIPLPYANTVGVVTGLGFPTGTLTSITSGAVYVDHGINHQAFGDVTKTLHNHTLIAGFSYDHYEKQENNHSNANAGNFSFNNDVGYGAVVQQQLTGVSEDQAFANFLLGNANLGFSQTSLDPKIDINQEVYEAFAQDNWKVSPRLTLNLGVRYSYYGQPWDDAGFLSNFDPNTYSASKAPTISNGGLICLTACATNISGTITTPANSGTDFNGANYLNGLIYGLSSTANNNQASPYGNKVGTAQAYNFAPRVGFAYDLFGDGKTALRGGYGWSYDETEVSQYEVTGIGSTYTPNPPAASSVSPTAAVLDNPVGGVPSTTPSTTPGHLYAVPLHFKTPYVQQYSLGIQQQVTPTLLFEIGYFGTHGTHLAGQEEINQPVPGAWRGVIDPRNASSTCTLNGGPAFLSSTCDRALNQIKPYQGYYAIDALQTIFSSNYNGLQTKITKRFAGKSYIDGNFTWARDLTNSPEDLSGFVQNIYNVNGDYGRAADDRKLVMNIDGVWELPWYREQHGLKGRLIGGWEISATYSANSGEPLTIAISGGSTINYNLPGGINGLNGSTTGGVGNDNAGLALLGNTNGGLRPNQIADPNKGYGLHLHSNKTYESSNALWFYTGAFTAEDPNSNTPGNAKRGTINGPGFQRADLGVFRNFRIYNNLSFQFRAEAFNVANHTNVQSIGTSATSATYGEITGYRDARIMQFAGRFDF